MKSSLLVLYIYFLTSVYSAIDDGVTSDLSSEPSVCTEIPTIENAQVSSTTLKSNYSKGESLIYKCQQGYTGRIIIVCNGKKWENTQKSRCSRKRCELPKDIPNGKFILANGTEFVYGTTIRYICNVGYRMASREDNRTCLAGGWSNHLPQCEEIVCYPPVVNNNLIVDGFPDYEESPIRHGHRLHFRCVSTAHKLIGPREVICGIDGQWSNPFPRCEEATCDEEQLYNVKIVDGNPGISPPFKPKHTLTFQCSKSYFTMIGQSVITCREDGTWSSPYPKCLAGCNPPPNVQFADLTTLYKSYYRNRERVQYKCQNYYTISEQTIKTCENGVWTGSVNCLKPCTVTLQDMDANHIRQRYGEKKLMFAVHGDHISFVCQYGFTPGGNDFRRQCNDGVMNLPYCH